MSSPPDERLTRALAPHASGPASTDEQWAAVVARGRRIRGGGRRRRAVVLATAAALVIATIALVRLDRGESARRVTAGDPAPTAFEPGLLTLADASIDLADALADEARTTVLVAGDLTVVRNRTDVAAASWQAARDRHPATTDEARQADEVVGQNFELLQRQNRLAWDRGHVTPGRLVRELGNLSEQVAGWIRTRAAEAPSAGGARQLADAADITRLAVQSPWAAALAGAPPDSGEGVRVRSLTRPRRDAVREVLGDRRLGDEVERRRADQAAGRPTSSGDAALAALAADREDRLVAVARTVLAEPPAATTPVPQAVLDGVVRAEVALRAARDQELWVTLVGDGPARAAARERVDTALAAARGARATMALDPAVLAEANREAAGVDELRRSLDTGRVGPVDTARALATAADGEAAVLATALEAGPTAGWAHGLATAMVSESVSRHVHAAGLAVLHLDGAPAVPGGVDVTEVQTLEATANEAAEIFNERSTPGERARWRSSGDARASYITHQVSAGLPIADGGPWASQVAQVRTSLDGMAAAAADIAGR
jgi:hypothetical protein